MPHALLAYGIRQQLSDRVFLPYRGTTRYTRRNIFGRLRGKWRLLKIAYSDYNCLCLCNVAQYDQCNKIVFLSLVDGGIAIFNG